VDHRGVPNFILQEEDKYLASVYKNKSIAEQNSVDLAWNTLMEPEFEALRSTIYTDISELKRFRQCLVNCKCYFLQSLLSPLFGIIADANVLLFWFLSL
jgi:hypothetical protein